MWNTEKNEKSLFRLIESLKKQLFFYPLLNNKLSIKYGFVLKGNYI